MACSDACVRLIPLKENMNQEDLARFDTASNNGNQCSQKCRELFTASDTAVSILKKLRNIPFDSIFPKKNDEKRMESLMRMVLKDLIKTADRLQKVAEKMENCNGRPKVLPLPAKSSAKLTVTTQKKKFVATTNIQNSKEVVATTTQAQSSQESTNNPIVASVIDPKINLPILLSPSNPTLPVLEGQIQPKIQILPQTP